MKLPSGRFAAMLAMLVYLVVEISAPTVASSQTLDDLDDAERVVEELEAELDAATLAYETAWARIEEAQAELDQIEGQVGFYERESRESQRDIALRARNAYILGAGANIEALLASGDSQEAVERAGMIAALQRRQGVRIEHAVASQLRLEQTRDLVADRRAQLDVLQAELDARAEELSTLLAAAERRESEIRSLVSRQRRISRADQEGIYACIFDSAYRFRNTWGAPRSGGRRHKGTDVFAPMGHPTYAFTSGVVQRVSRSRLGGIGLYLRGDDGNVYYYAHLNSVEASGAVGNRVVPGELIARNGASGNASRSAPHVHFELHPGGGSAINPYAWLAAACF